MCFEEPPAGNGKQETTHAGDEMAKLTSNLSGNYKTYGIKTADPGRRHTGLYRVIIVLLLLIVCAAAVWGIKRHIDLRRNNASVKTPGEAVENGLSTRPLVEERTISENLETSSAILEHQARSSSPETDTFDFREYEQQRMKQQRNLYDNALQLFNERKFEQSRTILRDMLGAMDSNEPLYDAAASLLGRASMNIYRSGNDSETNVAYTVKSGDTLSKIALNYNTSVAAIQKVNGMTTTKLSIGQKLKIPQSVWSIVIRRSDDKLILYANKKIFKIYNVYPGSAVGQSYSGTFRIFSKQKDPVWRVDGKTYQPNTPGNIIGPRWIALKGIGASADASGTAIHGTNRSGTPDASPGAPGYFRMSNADAIELYDLVPLETVVEIKGSAR